MNIIAQQSVSSLLDVWIAEEHKGKTFPVPFDVAWGMAGYSTKADAKRGGLKSLRKGVHFSAELMKNARAGRPSELIKCKSTQNYSKRFGRYICV